MSTDCTHFCPCANYCGDALSYCSSTLCAVDRGDMPLTIKKVATYVPIAEASPLPPEPATDAVGYRWVIRFFHGLWWGMRRGLGVLLHWGAARADPESCRHYYCNSDDW